MGATGGNHVDGHSDELKSLRERKGITININPKISQGFTGTRNFYSRLINHTLDYMLDLQNPDRGPCKIRINEI